MKKIRPGQFYWHLGHLFRAARRTNGCKGCILDDIIICPNVHTKTNRDTRPDCEENRIIFVKA